MRNVTLEDGTQVPVKSLKYATMRDLNARQLSPQTISKHPDPVAAADEAVRIVLAESIGPQRAEDFMENGLNRDVLALYLGILAETYGVKEEEKN